MYTREEIPNLVPALLSKLKELPEGSWTNTAGLVMTAGFEIVDESLLSDIHRALFEAAEANRIFLDMSSHEGKMEGLPYNLSFQVFFDQKTYWYCGVVLKGTDYPYSYISDTGYIDPGSFVAVPFGSNNEFRIGKVTSCFPRMASTAPYPVEQTKHIIRMATQDEYDEPRVCIQSTVMPGDDECDLDELRDHIADEDWEAVTEWAVAHESSKDPAILDKIPECYRLASDNGYIPASVCLANLYYVGRFVEQDYREAFRLNKIAADAGDRQGLTNCGYCCYYGRHKEADYAEACMYYSLGAMLYNDANCLYKLGDLFRYGYGVEKNEIYAYMLYRRAFDRCGESESDYGSTPDCAMRIGECELRGIGTEIDVDDAHVKLNYALMNFYRIRKGDPFVPGLIEKTKKLIAEAEAILDAEISRNA